MEANMSLIPKKPLGRFLLLAVTSACPLAAHAGVGPYIGIEGGLNLLDNQKLDAYGFTGLDDGARIGHTEFSSGWLVGETGRASCRVKMCQYVCLCVLSVSLKKTKEE